MKKIKLPYVITFNNSISNIPNKKTKGKGRRN